MNTDGIKRHLDQLRKHRNRPDPDYSLNFLKNTFKNEVEKPYKQLGELAELWTRLVPDNMARHTKLINLRRGLLTIAVSSNAHLYQIDRLLRQGLNKQLTTMNKQKAIRRIQLRVDPQVFTEYNTCPTRNEQDEISNDHP